MSETVSRTEKSKRNTLTGLLMQVVYLLASFATRTLLIKFLGAGYLGLNSVFQNIVGVLSVAELGFGTAILVTLYKPVADDDRQKIKALLGIYRKVYTILAVCIFAVGLCILPFINSLAGNDPSVTGIPSTMVYWYFLVFLLTSSASYIFAYKRSLVIAAQNQFVDNLNNTIFTIVKNGLMIASFYVFAKRGDHQTAFLMFLVVQPILVLLENISISVYVDKKYPYIKNNKEKLDALSKKDLKNSTFTLFLHKAAETLVTGTDSIIIASLLGVTVAGYYSNYLLILSVGSVIVLLPMKQISASMGNLVVSGDKEKTYVIFRRLMFGYFILLGFITGGMLVLSQDFIQHIWLAKEVANDSNYLLPFYILITILVSFYVHYSREPIAMMKECTQMFRFDWGYSIARPIINLVVSIVLTYYFGQYLGWGMGIVGDVVGTIVCYVSTSILEEPFYVYKRFFAKSPLPYYVDYLVYSLVNFVAIVVAYYSCCFIPCDFGGLLQNIGMFIVKGLTVIGSMSVVYLLCYFKHPSFKYYLTLFLRPRKAGKKE
jgi:O-antigen/teichoic acid export membrane protein